MNEEQFLKLCSEEQESLRRFLFSLCGGDMPSADDIAQEAMLKAYLSREKFEGRASFSTWLFRIAYNCFYDWKKKNSLWCMSADSADKRNAAVQILSDEEADAGFRYQRLNMAISGLSDNEKTAVLLFYMEGKTVKEISSITGIRPVTVRSHLFRARKHLKEFLENQNI